MALTVDKLINDDRFCGDNVMQFLLYLPFGILLLVARTFLALILWLASIILPNKSAVRQMLSTMACWTFGVYVKLKGSRDPRCNVLVANYVSCLDSLAASHVLGTISLRKWKVPPFFASTLGIRNVAQFNKKQLGECGGPPLLLQPEGGPTNGRGLLQFTEWPNPAPARVQPVAISVSRWFTSVTVQGNRDARGGFPWGDALWFLWSPATMYTVTLLPSVKGDQVAEARQAIADCLQIECTSLTWSEVCAAPDTLRRLAGRVRAVLPHVPLNVIMADLAITRSVDETISKLLDAAAPPSPPTPQHSRAHAHSRAPDTQTEPAQAQQSRYITPAPTGVFPKSAKERQLSFQERKAQMIEEARNKYIEKHGLNIALNNC